MQKKIKDPVLVVLQLTGGNDYLNTVIPYSNPDYYDNRPTLGIPEEQVIKLNPDIGLHPAMMPLKNLYDNGEMSIIHGIGFEKSTRSHFRAMDIWHTAEPEKVGTEGWLGNAVRQIDPKGSNPVTAVNVGHGLPRALVAPGVSVASVSDLSNYGMLTVIEQEKVRQNMLKRFEKMYAPSIKSNPIMEYLGKTGLDALKGADMLKDSPIKYSSSVEYGNFDLAKKLRDVSIIHTSNVGTRIFYVEHGGFDTHASQGKTHEKLWQEASSAIVDFWDDLKQHDSAENVIMFVFSEFGRRVKENGSGTDHGAAGVSFVFGPNVNGGISGEYPETKAELLREGDLNPNLDFRSSYSTLLENWLNINSNEILNGTFEKYNFIK